MAGVPQKIPKNPKNIGKMAKNAPTVQSENAPKRVKMAKNDQKLAKMAKKWQLETVRALDLPAGGTRGWRPHVTARMRLEE